VLNNLFGPVLELNKIHNLEISALVRSVSLETERGSRDDFHKNQRANCKMHIFIIVRSLCTRGLLRSECDLLLHLHVAVF
jgi:hypothetical protein